jgi:hypothetical protein
MSDHTSRGATPQDEEQQRRRHDRQTDFDTFHFLNFLRLMCL